MTTKHKKNLRKTTGLEKRLGHTFWSSKLLRDALTHSTYANEHASKELASYRLRFIGDAVLGLLASQILYNRFTTAREGELNCRRERLERRETLAMFATRLNLNNYILFGKGQKKCNAGGASKRILADVFEALAGAIYLDGGYDAVKRCFSYHMLADLEQARELKSSRCSQ